jgi:ABC-type uncharacterized transport system permease subunit
MSPRWAGWAGVALGVVAAYLTLPPLLVRSPIPSIVVAGAAVGLGLAARSGGQRRLGWGAVVAGVLGAVLAVVFARSGEANLERVFVWSGLLAATLRYATPLTFAALGGVVSERSGVVNIGLEGMMIAGAYFSFWGADMTSSWVAGLAIGVAAGGLFGFIHALFSITLHADQIVSGVAINLLALGVTGYLFVAQYGSEGSATDLPEVPDVHLPIGWIPFVGEALEDLNLLVWLSLVFVVAVAVFLFRTPAGLRLRSVGENPLAADTAGIGVERTRYAAVIASGMLAAMGGAFLSIGFVHSFSQNMTAGRGFIALAAVISGKWRPGGALAAALLFGCATALAQRLPAFSPQLATLFAALPYVLTLIAVAGLVGRSRPPAADGIPYERQ